MIMRATMGYNSQQGLKNAIGTVENKSIGVSVVR